MGPVLVLYAIRIYGQHGVLVLPALLALLPQRHGADTVLTGLLERSVLHGVLAGIGPLGFDLLEGPSSRTGTQITKIR